MNLNKLNLAAIWTAVTTTAIVMLWILNNLAWSADIERIEANQLRSEVRNLCYKYVTAPEIAKEMVGTMVLNAVDDLCRIDDTSRFCDGETVKDICQ